MVCYYPLSLLRFIRPVVFKLVHICALPCGNGCTETSSDLISGSQLVKREKLDMFFKIPQMSVTWFTLTIYIAPLTTYYRTYNISATHNISPHSQYITRLTIYHSLTICHPTHNILTHSQYITHLQYITPLTIYYPTHNILPNHNISPHSQYITNHNISPHSQYITHLQYITHSQ